MAVSNISNALICDMEATLTSLVPKSRMLKILGIGYATSLNVLFSVTSKHDAGLRKFTFGFQFYSDLYWKGDFVNSSPQLVILSFTALFVCRYVTVCPYRPLRNNVTREISEPLS
jgi:hypothetical protein